MKPILIGETGYSNSKNKPRSKNGRTPSNNDQASHRDSKKKLNTYLEEQYGSLSLGFSKGFYYPGEKVNGVVDLNLQDVMYSKHIRVTLTIRGWIYLEDSNESFESKGENKISPVSGNEYTFLDHTYCLFDNLVAELESSNYNIEFDFTLQEGLPPSLDIFLTTLYLVAHYELTAKLEFKRPEEELTIDHEYVNLKSSSSLNIKQLKPQVYSSYPLTTYIGVNKKMCKGEGSFKVHLASNSNTAKVGETLEINFESTGVRLFKGLEVTIVRFLKITMGKRTRKFKHFVHTSNFKFKKNNKGCGLIDIPEAFGTINSKTIKLSYAMYLRPINFKLFSSEIYEQKKLLKSGELFIVEKEIKINNVQSGKVLGMSSRNLLVEPQLEEVNEEEEEDSFL